MGKNPVQKAKDAANKKAVEGSTKVESSRKKPVKAKIKKVETASKGKSCRITSCKREYRAKGYCRVHYKKWRQGEYGDVRYKRCHERAGCVKPMGYNRHGFCEDHFQSYYVKGEATAKVEAPATPEKASVPTAKAAASA